MTSRSSRRNASLFWNIEQQYQRIADSIDQLRAFVNKHKEVIDGQPGILSADAAFQSDDSAAIGEQLEDILEGILLLEDCAKAFIRDHSPEVRRLVRMFDSQHDSCAREF